MAAKKQMHLAGMHRRREKIQPQRHQDAKKTKSLVLQRLKGPPLQEAPDTPASGGLSLGLHSAHHQEKMSELVIHDVSAL
jgi:hypothetical protein